MVCIEAMFRDCKLVGYNLEGSQASPDRLIRLILLIVLAMSLHGYWTKNSITKNNLMSVASRKSRTRKRHSILDRVYMVLLDICFQECQVWVEQLIGSFAISRHFIARV